jgi:hypothetical protein
MMRTDGESKYPGIAMAIQHVIYFHFPPHLGMESPMRFSSYFDTNKSLSIFLIYKLEYTFSDIRVLVFVLLFPHQASASSAIGSW